MSVQRLKAHHFINNKRVDNSIANSPSVVEKYLY